MSEANRPVNISRAKAAPVAQAIATLVPQIVDAEGDLERGLERRHHRRHARDAFRRRGEAIGSVVLIAEHDGVDAALLQFFDISRGVFDQPVHAAIGVVQRRSRQRPDMSHRDDDFASRAEKIERHRNILFEWETGQAVARVSRGAAMIVSTPARASASAR